MTSNVLKCSECNVVINELLAFIQNKVEIMSDESIVNLCSTAFAEEDIVRAKNLLFDSVKTAERNIVRRKDKGHKNIQDMVSIMRRIHPDEIPIFVARDLHKLPPVTFDHIDCTRLLKDLIILRKDIESVKGEYVTRIEYDLLKKEFLNLKEASLVNNFEGGNYINMNRGGCLRVSHAFDTKDSGPYGILDVSKKEISMRMTSSPIPREYNKETMALESMTVVESGKIVCDKQQHSIAPSPSSARIPPVASSRTSPSRKNVEASTAVSNGTAISPVQTVVQSNTHECEGVGECVVCRHVEASTMVSNNNEAPAHQEPLIVSEIHSTQCKQTFADKLKESVEWKQTQPNEDWVTVQRKRLRNRFVGMTGKAVTNPAGKFKAAVLNVPLYIDYVDKNASVSDICQYIFENTQIRVELENIPSKRIKHYNSFKVMVPRHKLAIFMDRNLWPDGIIFRRFVNFNRDKK